MGPSRFPVWRRCGCASSPPLPRPPSTMPDESVPWRASPMISSPPPVLVRELKQRSSHGRGLPGDSPEYRAARDRLLEQEAELRRATEAVAVARRELPPGGVVPEDYIFQGTGADGSPTDVPLSELFAPRKESLVIYSMMFPRDPGDQRQGPDAEETAHLPLAEGPCPSCTALLDQLEAATGHVTQRVNLVAVGKSPLQRTLTFAKERGWLRLRLLSSAGNTYNRDYLAETAEGSQMPILNVFHRDGDTIRHFRARSLLYASTEPGQEYRHVGTIEPLWNLFDLTPEGRGTDWDDQLSYS